MERPPDLPPSRSADYCTKKSFFQVNEWCKKKRLLFGQPYQGEDDNDFAAEDVHYLPTHYIFAELHSQAELQAACAKFVRRNGHNRTTQWIKSALEIAFP